MTEQCRRSRSSSRAVRPLSSHLRTQLTPATEPSDSSSSFYQDIVTIGATQDFKCSMTPQRLEHSIVSHVCRH
jgi:hypothetical protein